MRRICALTLVFVLAGAPLLAQDLRASIDRAVAESVLQQGAQEGRIPPGYLWTGISLLGAGGFYLARGATVSEFSQTCVLSECVNNKKVWLWTGTALAGTGAALLFIGIGKRSNSPQIVTTPGGFRVRQTVRF